MSIRVGIIGAGDIARVHVRAIRAAGGNVVAVSALSERESKAFALEHDIELAFEGAESLLERVDAVVIATPNGEHAGQTIASVRAGVPVLCEIPAGVSLNEAVAVKDEAERSGVTVMVAHTLRFLEPMQRLRDDIAKSRFTPRHVILRRTTMRRTNAGWSGQPRAWADSIVWHHGAHQVDFALWLLQGERADLTKITVHGSVGSQRSIAGQPLDLGAVLGVEDGGLVSLSLSYNSSRDVEDALIIGDERTYVFSNGQLRSTSASERDSFSRHISPGVQRDVEGSPASRLDDLKKQAIRAQDAEFLRAISEGRQPRSSIKDILPAMHVLQALVQEG